MTKEQDVSLIDQLRKIRDRADQLIRAFRYCDLASDEACLAVLADAGERAWRNVDYVRRELQRGGRSLGKGRVSDVLRELEGDGRLECQSVPTGRQGPDEKRYRLPRG